MVGYYVVLFDGCVVVGVIVLLDGGVLVWNIYVCVELVEDVVVRAMVVGGIVVVGLMDVLLFGCLVVLVDFFGVVLSLWESCERTGVELVNQLGAWMMSLLHMSDLVGANVFYGVLFGWELVLFGLLMLYWFFGYVGGYLV